MRMKKLIFSSLILMVSTLAIAQPNNRIKFGLTGALFKQANIKYERVVNPESSIQLTIGIRPNSSTSMLRPILKGSLIEDRMSGIVINPEYRWYFSQNGNAQGLYGGAFVDWYLYSLKNRRQIDDKFRELKLNFRSVGMGLMFGGHWYFDNNVSIDVYFIGVGYARNKLTAIYTTNDLGFSVDGVISDVNQFLGDIPFFEEVVSQAFDEVSFRAAIRFGMPRIRVGLSLGYSF